MGRTKLALAAVAAALAVCVTCVGPALAQAPNQTPDGDRRAEADGERARGGADRLHGDGEPIPTATR